MDMNGKIVVLIESDWNLKEYVDYLRRSIGWVLIESDWNLKFPVCNIRPEEGWY